MTEIKLSNIPCFIRPIETCPCCNSDKLKKDEIKNGKLNRVECFRCGFSFLEVFNGD